MNRNMDGRVAKLEAQRRGDDFAHRFVRLPLALWDLPHEENRHAIEEALREHGERTGYWGPVAVFPEECSREEWMARAERRGLGMAEGR